MRLVHYPRGKTAQCPAGDGPHKGLEGGRRGRTGGGGKGSEVHAGEREEGGRGGRDQ